MVSLEEENLEKMVRDFIESESTHPISPSSSLEPIYLPHQSRYLTLQEVLWSVTEAEIEVLEKISMHLRNSAIGGAELTIMNKWVAMRLKMNGFEASLCKTSWAASFGCPAGDYEYIDVILKDGKPTRLIVDIDFKSQFELARPTPAYKDLTNLLPSIFVGNEEKLKKIITLLCSAAKESLKEKGLHIPPWRKSSYILSKWFSEDCKKVPSQNYKEVCLGNEATKKSNAYCSNNLSKWVPPAVEPRRKDLGGGGGGGSGLSSQFHKMGINCC